MNRTISRLVCSRNLVLRRKTFTNVAIDSKSKMKFVESHSNCQRSNEATPPSPDKATDRLRSAEPPSSHKVQLLQFGYKEIYPYSFVRQLSSTSRSLTLSSKMTNRRTSPLFLLRRLDHRLQVDAHTVRRFMNPIRCSCFYCQVGDAHDVHRFVFSITNWNPTDPLHNVQTVQDNVLTNRGVSQGSEIHQCEPSWSLNLARKLIRQNHDRTQPPVSRVDIAKGEGSEYEWKNTKTGRQENNSQSQNLRTRESEKFRFTMKDGSRIELFQTKDDDWIARISEMFGALSRTQTMPVYCDEKTDVRSSIRSLTAMSESCRRRCMHLLKHYSTQILFIGELGLKAGGCGPSCLQIESEEPQQAIQASPLQRPIDDTRQSERNSPRRRYEAAGPSTSSTRRLEHIPSQQVRQTLRDKGIDTTEKLVAEFNVCEDAEERRALLEWLHRIVFVFDEMSVVRVTMGRGDVLREYQHLSKLCTDDPMTSSFTRDYFDSLCRKFEDKSQRDVYLIRAIESAFALVDALSFEDGTIQLIELARTLISQLDPKNTSFSDATYAFEGPAMRALHSTLELIGKIEPQSWRPNQSGGLSEQFLAWCQSVLESEARYPIRHQAMLIRQSLSRLQSNEARDVRGNNSRVILSLLGGAVNVLRLLRNAALIDFDASDMISAARMLRSSGNKIVKSNTWYEWHLMLDLTCCLSLKDPSLHEEFSNSIAHVVQFEGELRNFEERKAICYSIIERLKLLAVNSQSRKMRLQCMKAIADYLDDSESEGGWSNDPDIVEAVLGAMSNVLMNNEESERNVAWKHVERLANCESKSPAMARVFDKWYELRSRRLEAETSSSQTDIDLMHALFKEVEKKLSDKTGDKAIEDVLPAPNVVRHYAARMNEFEELVNAFTETHATDPIVKVLVGPGGMGKSQLATKVYEHLTGTISYDRKYWIPSTSEKSLEDSFRKIAQVEGIEIDAVNIEVTVRRVVARLRDLKCLYIFDDARDEPLIWDYLPKKFGHVIVTSRHQHEGHWSVPPSVLLPFDIDDAVTLCHTLRLTVNDDFIEQLRDVFPHIPKYPLCLAQFFAAMKVEGFSLHAWLRLNNELESGERESQLLRQLEAGLSELGKNASGILAVFESSLERLRSGTGRTGEQAEQLLKSLAYLDPNGVPLSWLLEWQATDEEDFLRSSQRRALALLEKLAFVSWNRSDQMIYMHAESQLIMRYKAHKGGCLSRDEGRLMAERVESYIQQFTSHVTKRKASEDLLPHMRAMMLHFDDDANKATALKLAKNLIDACKITLNYTERLKWARRRLCIATEIEEEESEEILSALRDVGESLAALSKYNEALDHYRYALALVRAIHSNENHTDVAMSLHYIGRVLRNLGRYDEALDHHRRALAMREAVYGEKNHTDIATSLDNIGNVLDNLGRYDEALDHLRRALTIRQAVYGDENHTDIAMSLNNIGNVLYNLDRYDDALDHHCRALMTWQAMYGDENHTDIAMSLNNIGNVLYKLERYNEALDHHRRALAMRQAVYGDEDHTDVAASFNNIGSVLDNMGRYDEALDHLRRALTIRQAVYGHKNHTDVATSFNNIGLVLYHLGRYDEALDHLRRALTIWQVVYGDADHTNVAMSFNNIGYLLYKQSRNDEALENFNRALATYKAVYGEDAENDSILSVQQSIDALYTE